MILKSFEVSNIADFYTAIIMHVKNTALNKCKCFQPQFHRKTEYKRMCSLRFIFYFNSQNKMCTHAFDTFLSIRVSTQLVNLNIESVTTKLTGENFWSSFAQKRLMVVIFFFRFFFFKKDEKKTARGSDVENISHQAFGCASVSCLPSLRRQNLVTPFKPFSMDNTSNLWFH